MKRLLIVGPPGSGKSTLARKLAEQLGLPAVHLDAMFWSSGWVMRSEEEFRQRLAAALSQETWIIDGAFASSLAQRLERADTVIYLDFPTLRCLWRVLKRIATHHGKTRPDMAENCPERFDFEFVRYICGFRKTMRPKIEALLKEDADVQVHRLRTPAEVERFCSELDLNLPAPTLARR